MKTDYTIYRHDGTTEHATVDWPQEPCYDRLAALIEPIVGNPMKYLRVLHQNEPHDMFIDGLGLVRDNLKPINEAASLICATTARARGVDPGQLPPIFGNAILFDRRVWY